MNHCTGAEDCDCPSCEEDNREATRLEAALVEFDEDGSFYAGSSMADQMEDDEYRAYPSSPEMNDFVYQQQLEVLPAAAVDGFVRVNRDAPLDQPGREFVYHNEADQSGRTLKHNYRSWQDRYWQRKP